MEDRGILSIYNKDLQLVDTLPPVNLLVRYRKYSRIFSVGSNIILQTRYRPHRDTRQTVSDSTEDKELLHQEFDRYDNESYYSMLFYYHYDEKKWFEVDLKGFNLPVCCTLVKSFDQKKVYFLSSMNQGYVLDTESWKLKPLHLKGRPETLSIGSGTTFHDDKLIFSVGGGVYAFGELNRRLFSNILGRSSKSSSPKPPKTKLDPKKKRRDNEPKVQPPTIVKYYNDLLLLDLKTKQWVIPTISGDTNTWPKGLGFSSVISYQNKILVFGGQNKDGEVKKVWVFEEDTSPPPTEVKKKTDPEEELYDEDDD